MVPYERIKYIIRNELTAKFDATTQQTVKMVLRVDMALFFLLSVPISPNIQSQIINNSSRIKQKPLILETQSN